MPFALLLSMSPGFGLSPPYFTPMICNKQKGAGGTRYIERALTLTVPQTGVSIVVWLASLTSEALSVVQTLETLASGGIAVARHIRVNVVVTLTQLTGSPRNQWVAVVVLRTSAAAVAWLSQKDRRTVEMFNWS